MKTKKSQLKIQKSSDFCLFNAKGQLKIKQMSFMLLAVVSFFIIAGLFFLSFSFSNLKGKVSELNQEESISLAARLAGSTEFGCVGKDYCISTDKLLVIKSMPAYSSLFDVSRIEVQKIGNQSRECNFGNYPDCEVFKITNNNDSNQISTSIFASLCRKEYENGNVYDKCELGKLLVYYKQL